MRPFSAMREAAIATFVLIAMLGVPPLATGAQPALPPIAPTTQTIAPADTVSAPAPAPVHQAEVSYQMGQLTVIAQNSSLDAILRDIARKTGMKITGNVASQQVYGTYGPAAPATVLASLLEGSGNNMILREDVSSHPVELVLAPTQGAPSSPIATPSSSPGPQPYRPPPSDAPPQFNRPQVPPAEPRPPIYTQQAIPNPSANPGQPAETLAPTTTSMPDQSAEPSGNVPQSPNGVPTPQQIFQELQQLQQRQKAQPPAPVSTPAQ